MSKFFKALAQAERDRVLRAGARPADRTKAVPPVASLAAPAIEMEREWQPPRALTETLPADPTGRIDDHLVSLIAPAAFEAEQYRALRHAVEHLHKAAGLQVFAVSSPCVGDGKTLTAINLAGALAQSRETRVLLVDADLRRPAVGRMLGLDGPRPGLANAILDPGLPIDHVIQWRPPFNLAVICSGAANSSPYELLKSPRVGELLHDLRQRYDYIVIDTPPLTPVQDCRVIGRWVDGFLVVVAALRTPRRFVDQALTIVDRAKILGLVFNNEADRALLGGHSHYYTDYFPRSPSSLDEYLGAVRRAIGAVVESVGAWRTRR